MSQKGTTPMGGRPQKVIILRFHHKTNQNFTTKGKQINVMKLDDDGAKQHNYNFICLREVEMKEAFEFWNSFGIFSISENNLMGQIGKVKRSS